MPLTKGVLELMNETSLAATATVPTAPGGTECSVVDLTEVAQCAFELEAVFNASGTEPCVFHFVASASGGTASTEWDTVDYDCATLACVAGARAQMHHVIDPSPKYVQVYAVNEDLTHAMTAVKVTREIQSVEAL